MSQAAARAKADFRVVTTSELGKVGGFLASQTVTCVPTAHESQLWESLGPLDLDGSSDVQKLSLCEILRHEVAFVHGYIGFYHWSR